MIKGKQRDDETYRRFIEYVAEAGLEGPIRNICYARAVTPRDIYLDTRGPSALAARLEVWWMLARVVNKTMGEIGTIFDRNPSSIKFAVNRIAQKAKQVGWEVNGATVHDLCGLIADDVRDHWERSGAAAFKKIGKKEP